jgi:hypothetical protein
MSLVEKSIQSAAAPAQVDIGTRLEGGCDLAQCSDGHFIEMTSLDKRDHRLRQASPRAKVNLAPATPTAKHPNREANPTVVHMEMIPIATHRRLTRH